MARRWKERRAKLVALAVDAVKRARNCVSDVQFYAEDAGRADPLYLFEMLEAVIDAGATVVNIPDTTGYTVPEQYGATDSRHSRQRSKHCARNH